MRMDWTLNIPTVISIMTLAGSVGIGGFKVYQDLDQRQTATSYAVKALTDRTERIESNIEKLKLDASTRNTELRTEIKSDITEIKGLLNEVIFGRGTPRAVHQQQLNEWRK